MKLAGIGNEVIFWLLSDKAGIVQKSHRTHVVLWIFLCADVLEVVTFLLRIRFVTGNRARGFSVGLHCKRKSTWLRVERSDILGSG